MNSDVPSLAEVRRRTEKKRDAWWTVLLVDPVATPLVRWTARYTRFTPNQITWSALALGLGAAVCFAFGEWKWLLAGAALYHVSFILDCMDGKLARLTGNGSVFGAWLDYVFDRVRVLACAIALMGGQYARTGETAYLWLALAVTFLDMLRYVDALQIFKIRHGMRKQIKTRVRELRRAGAGAGADIGIRAEAGIGAEAGAWADQPEERELAFMEDLLRDNPSADMEADEGQQEEEEEEPQQPQQPGRKPAVVDLHQEFRHRFPWYAHFRTFLLRHRIRTHLISGIEFQMAVFIVAPAVDAIVPVTIGAASLLLVFELAIIYKLLLSTRDFGRTMASFGPVPEKEPRPVSPIGTPAESAAHA